MFMWRRIKYTKYVNPLKCEYFSPIKWNMGNIWATGAGQNVIFLPHFRGFFQRLAFWGQLSSSPKVTKGVYRTDSRDVVQWTNRKEYVLLKILHFCSNFIQFVNYFYHVIDISIQFVIVAKWKIVTMIKW